MKWFLNKVLELYPTNNNIINEIFIQDVHFSVTYIAINMYPVINVKL